MSESYKHSYKSGENLLNSLSVYNVGYQKCDPGYQWGPGVRDHFCIHHILSGSGYYSAGGKSLELHTGDTFILYPGVEVKYYADQEEPWEYGWVGFMGTDAPSIIRNTEFRKHRPYILAGRIPEQKIRDGIQAVFDVKGNSYEEAVAMTGALYSLLSVFMHYSKTNKVCATCAYWTGSRNLVNSGNSSEPTSNSAKCQIPNGSNRGSTKFCSSSCSNWAKWPVLK